jgi:hypothetical protein
VATGEYRRRKGDGAQPWHFCSNCKSWPTQHYESTTLKSKPVCRECEGLDRRQMCTKEDAYYL